ncbi:MAG: hypothetical protein KDA21_00185 [Phycisphaerales bacterium]|nr:hypothetical protein [Phycisphaerales bacterium]
MNSRRGMPVWWRRPGRVIVLLGAVLLVWVVWRLLLVLTAEPGRSVDYAEAIETLRDQMSPRPQGVTFNAWKALDDLRARQVELDGDFWSQFQGNEEDFQWGGAVPESWVDGEPVFDPRITWMLERMDEVDEWSAISRIAQSPWGRGASIEGVLMDHVQPNLGCVRQLSELLRARALQHHARGEDLQAVARLADVLGLARLGRQQPYLVAQLVAAAVEGTALRDFRTMLATSDLLPEVCDAMARAMDQHAGPADVAYAIECERLCVLQFVQSVYTDDGDGDGAFLYYEFLQSGFGAIDGIRQDWFLGDTRITNFMHRDQPGKAVAVDAVNTWFDGLRAQAVRRPGDRGLPLDALTEAQQDVVRSSFAVGYLVDDSPRWLGLCDINDTLRRGTRLMIAIEHHIAGTGAPPTNLEALVPDDIDALPEDPFGSGGFRYRVEGASYRLWSPGPDLEDDGGVGNDRRPGEEDIVLHPPAAPASE